jgi:pyruvate,water dikinase
MVGIAAVVQKMINSDKAGVMFSVDPVTQEDKILIEAAFGQGEGIVSGQIKPDQYVVSKEDLEIISEKISDKKIAIVRDSQGATKKIALTPEKSHQKCLKTHEIKELASFGIKLEKHYKKPQDIEFAVEDDQVYILQTRPITTLKDKEKHEEISGNTLLVGMGASPGISSGVVKIVLSMNDLDKVKKGDILVTTMTNPDMVVTMQRASAIVTDEGGVTAHAAIVSREMGIPCVVGTEEATHILKDGMEITVDGYTGKVYSGKTETKKAEVRPIVKTKTKIKVLVDLPDFAERAAKTNADGIGLVRLEGIIASSGKHPEYYIKNGHYEPYKNLIKEGIEKIAKPFKGKEIWIRTSDIRTDEFSHLKGAPEVEKNPMLGMHGIRYSLKNPDFFKAELLAIKEVAEEGGHKIGLMFPQVISAKEIGDTKKILHELDMRNKVKLGVMIETPAAVMIIEDLCKEGIQFISFGTNDLTQYTLAIDRGNEEVQYLYNEMEFSVLKEISRVIRLCKQNKVETSICGQAASRKDMVEFLVKQGIDSLSVNADSAYDISLFVKEIEEKIK